MTRYIRIGLVVVSIVWTIVNVLITVITKAPLVNLIALCGLVPLFTVLYQDIDWMFIKINKVRAWFSQKTVSFTVKHQIIVDNFDDIESLDSKIQTIFKKSELVIDETKSPNPSEETMYYQVINKNKLSFFISVAASRESDELTNLILKIEYQIAYRDVKQKWEDFLMLQQKIFNLYSCDVHEKPRFEVWIKTGNTQFNPFYRLTIRHLTNVRIDNFKLTYSDDNLKVTSTLHQIYAKSDSYIAIKKMIDEYVPLSNVL